MATLRTIRLRIKGTKNIKQITRAMEAVSAVKMRKSQGVALAARPYAIAALRLLNKLQPDLPQDEATPLLEQRPIANSLLIVVTSDKGLAGPFNANVLKKAEGFIKNAPAPVQFITVGKKGADYFSRRGSKPTASFVDFGDYAELSEVAPLFNAVLDTFVSKKTDEVHIIYTNFISALKQEVVSRKILPFSKAGLEEMVRGIIPERGKFSAEDNKETMSIDTEYLLEPSPREIFNELLPELLKIELYHAVLEANASEHSSRMVAMRNATDNAGDLIKSYTVSLNKARQAAINKELAEISGGSEALAA